jgi:hypothetical protein
MQRFLSVSFCYLTCCTVLHFAIVELDRSKSGRIGRCRRLSPNWLFVLPRDTALPAADLSAFLPKNCVDENRVNHVWLYPSRPFTVHEALLALRKQTPAGSSCMRVSRWSSAQDPCPGLQVWFVSHGYEVRASVATGLRQRACCIPTPTPGIPCSLLYDRDLNAAFSACVVCQYLPWAASGCPSYVNVPYLTSLLPCTPAAQHEWTRSPAYYMPTRTIPHG